jgi:hypothetical protein
MRYLIKIVTLLALLGSRVAIAQTVGKSSAEPTSPSVLSSLARGTPWMSSAPVGHRQPHAWDVPLTNPSDLEQLSAEDSAVDRKLNICRGC